jgi:hypothetical protein
MSYDVYFLPRTGDFGRARFDDYFRGRLHYQESFYQNEHTGVYFGFEFTAGDDQDPDDDGPSYPVSFNINYFRPSFFGLEAEPEVASFVHALDLTVIDVQMDGMGEGEFNSELFLSGWNRCNEFAYSALLRDPENRENIASLPTAQLHKAWTWNKAGARLQSEFGEATFVPGVFFGMLGGECVSWAVWPEGISIAVPDVDYFAVLRKELAPKRLFKRVDDTTFVARNDVEAIFREHQKQRPDGIVYLDYWQRPADVLRFVASLPRDTRKFERVTADRCLDRELVIRYAT